LWNQNYFWVKRGRYPLFRVLKGLARVADQSGAHKVAIGMTHAALLHGRLIPVLGAIQLWINSVNTL